MLSKYGRLKIGIPVKMLKHEKPSPAELDYLENRLMYLRQLQGTPSRSLLASPDIYQLNDEKIALLLLMQQAIRSGNVHSVEEVPPVARLKSLNEQKNEEGQQRREAEVRRKQQEQQESQRKLEERYQKQLEAASKIREEEDEKFRRGDELKEQEEREFYEKIFQAWRDLESQCAGLSKDEAMNLFSQTASSLIDKKRCNIFFNAILKRDMYRIESFLRISRLFLYLSYDITDKSKRFFPNITAFQYVFWSLDVELCELLLRYLPLSDAGFQFKTFETHRKDIIKKHKENCKIKMLCKILTSKVGESSNDELMAPIPFWLETAFYQKGLFKKSQDNTKVRVMSHSDRGIINSIVKNALHNYGLLRERILREIKKEEECCDNAVECELAPDPEINNLYDITGKNNNNLSENRRSSDQLLGSSMAFFTPTSAANRVLPIQKNPLQIMQDLDTSLRAELDYNQDDVDTMFRLCSRGDLHWCVMLLDKKPNYLHAMVTFKDLSNRQFRNITLFQYAVWVRDMQLWQLILKYLPKEAACRQLAVLENNMPDLPGPFYRLEGLISKITDFIFSKENDFKYGRATDLWCRGIGGEQQYVPAWLVMMWCEEKRNGNEVAWVKKDFGMNFGRDLTLLLMWFEKKHWGGKIGETFAVSRGNAATYYRSKGIDGYFSITRIKQDLEILRELSIYLENAVSELRRSLSQSTSVDYKMTI